MMKFETISSQSIIHHKLPRIQEFQDTSIKKFWNSVMLSRSIFMALPFALIMISKCQACVKWPNVCCRPLPWRLGVRIKDYEANQELEEIEVKIKEVNQESERELRSCFKVNSLCHPRSDNKCCPGLRCRTIGSEILPRCRP